MSKDINKIFGENLKRIRKEKSFSQEYIALEIDMDLTTISKYEKGTRCPNLKVASKIAKVLGVKLSQMVEEK